jgi:hypothetical protein
MPLATYKVYIDFTGGGNFVEAHEDVTQRVLDARQAVQMNYGRDQARSLSPIKAGTAQLALNNRDRYLSPENTSSPLYGNVQPGRRVKITATVASVETTLYFGYLDDFDLDPDYDHRYVSADCLDSLGRLSGQRVSTAVYQGLRPGEAIGILLDAIGWPADRRDLDVGTTIMPFWWLDEDDAYEALMELVRSEGPPALATVDSSDRMVFRGRHHRLQRAASLTSQATWYSEDVEPMFSPPAQYNHGWKEIINSVVFQLPQRAIGAVETVWQSEGQIWVAAGDTLPVTARATDPFVSAVTPVQTTDTDADGNPNGDYTLVSGTVTMSLSRTSGQSATIYITAASTAVIQDLKLRAAPVSTVNTTLVRVEDEGSITKFGRRSLPEDDAPIWGTRADAYGITQIILGQRAERLPTISVSMISANATRLAQQLNRNLSDRIHAIETHLGLDADCFIEQIDHEISEGGRRHRTTFGLEKIPTQLADVFILGSATSGVLGTDRLGRRGFTDPSMMFVLGTSLLGSGVLSP